MTPIGELRLGIPWSIQFYHFSLGKSFFLSELGNNFINLFLFFLAFPVANWLEKQSFFLGKFVAWIRNYLRKKGEKYYERWGSWTIFIVALIPLPGFGGWSAAGIAAFLGISPKRAVPALIAGTIVAGIIVLLSTKGIKLIF